MSVLKKYFGKNSVPNILLYVKIMNGNCAN